ncbi:hypothetical protein [Cellulosimicrobium funkei]|uniref:hypothetical protein n=1 Tax=Cellulosimicrobium funkei TaxID=264251 RepID=UPI00368861F3
MNEHGESERECVAIWRVGLSVMVMPFGMSDWGDDEGLEECAPPPIAWLQELRTTLDVDHGLVCAPIDHDLTSLVLPEADLGQVRRALQREGYEVVEHDPLPELPGLRDDLLAADIEALQSLDDRAQA